MGLETSDWSTPPTVKTLQTRDFLELEHSEPVACVKADWSEKLLKRRKLEALRLRRGGACGEVGPLADAPVLFEKGNAKGASTWRDGAGKIVVALRGDEEFEAMARRAEASGAAGLVVIDNEEVPRLASKEHVRLLRSLWMISRWPRRTPWTPWMSRPGFEWPGSLSPPLRAGRAGAQGLWRAGEEGDARADRA